MGDQNDDGCDDFIICKMDSRYDNWGYACFYYGGITVSENPVFRIRIYNPLIITGCDMNKDGYRDIVMRIGGFPQSVYRYKIYYGGSDLDTIPDASFILPDSTVAAYFIGKNWPIDFDGDGWEELVYKTSVIDKIYFIKNITENQSLEYYSIPRIGSMNYSEAQIFSSDLDGDGKSDITTLANDATGLKLLRFYFGNSSFDFSQFYEFSSDTVFHPEEYYLLNDMNGDGRGEIMVYLPPSTVSGGYGISFGSRPPNITPELRVNAGGLPGDGFSPGDVNGDGYGDLLQYVPYVRNALYLGGSTISGQAAQQYFSQFPDNSMDFIGGRVGDINGDGLDDICVGEVASGATLSHIYIYSGTRIPVSVKEEEEETAEENILSVTVSPNPTNGQISVQYTLPDSGVLRLEIFDILGRRIYSESSQREKGNETEQINLGNHTFSSGIYILSFTLETGEKTLTKNVKLQLTK
ncbi:MAG: hypothetical protein HBSAPP04_00090 [Ignavibacteriaceae bacterium]|nr:MAG: hypothetical protein HBSAPP04_00090 [Ignavibacteriaceae bacterium]